MLPGSIALAFLFLGLQRGSDIFVVKERGYSAAQADLRVEHIRGLENMVLRLAVRITP